MPTLTSPAITRRTLDDTMLSSAPLRACFLIDELALAGTETQLLALIRRFDRQRVEPYLCLLRGDRAASRALEPADCPVWRLGVAALARPRTLLKFAEFVRLLRRHCIDVLQVYFPDSTYFGLPAALLAGVPNRIRTRNNLGHWLTPWHHRLGRAMNGLTTATLTNCDAARQALLSAEAPPEESVHVLQNGVDIDRFLAVPALSEATPAQPCVGAVSNLRPVKGTDIFVAAARLVHDICPAAAFHIAGDGESRAEMEAAIAGGGLSERFFLPGSQRDVPEFLSGLDVAVLPSRAEGMSNALLEYMAAGRPIVATDVGGNAELIEDGVHGLLVPPEDPMALARAIVQLLNDRAFARRLGAAARQRARERFSREAMMQRFAAFYESLPRRRPIAGAST